MRGILDVNVLVSAVLSPRGAPADAVRAWRGGRFDLVLSPLLIDELRATLAYPKIRSRLPEDEAELWVALLRRDGVVLPDPPGPPPVRCADPDDDYLVALAAQARAVLVSGDRDVLALSPAIPVMSAREFLTLLDDVNPD